MIAHLFNNAHLVGYYNNRYAELFVYVAYKFKYLPRGLRVECTCRLVTEQNLGICRKCSRYCNALLLAARELSRISLGLVGKSDKG